MTMQPTDTIGELAIEPIEIYLRRSMCVDKLALYQPIIDLIKSTENYSIMDSINALVSTTSDQTSFDIIDELNDTLVKYLTQLIAEFDVICSSQDIIFLKEFYEILHLLDSFDQHETVINICKSDLDTRNKLYELLNLVGSFDEMIFLDYVVAVPLMLFDRLIEIHTAAMDAIGDIEHVVHNPENVQLLRKIAEHNPQAMVISLIRDQYLTMGMSAQQLTNLISPTFYDLNLRDAKRVAIELISLYLLTGESTGEVLKIVQVHLEQLVEDVSQAHGVFAVLQSTLSEIKAYE